MKKTFALFIIAALFTACQQSIEDRCAQEAKKYTEKNCPARIDEFTIIDSMTFERSTHTLHYYYRFTGFADRDDLNREQLRQALLADLKNTTSMKAYKDAGYNFIYTYRSEQHPDSLRFEAKFTAKDYNEGLTK